MVGIKCIVFDLDDTLYLERDYVRSGFRAVASAIGSTIGNEVLWFEFLWQGFLRGVRHDSFNRLLEVYPRVADEFTIPDLVSAYRAHEPDIHLSPETRVSLTKLRDNGFKIALITDGPYNVQRSKVESLGIEPLMDHLVLTGQWGKAYWKPHERSYNDVTETLNVRPHESVYIGDNPEKDFVGAKKLGWKTIRIRTPGQLHYEREPVSEEFAAHRDVQSLDEVVDIFCS